jgi:kynurenine formamidase
MTHLYDLSHPITDSGSCTFSTNDKRPVVTFEEGGSHGVSFVTSRIDNLYSNTATHVDLPGHLVDAGSRGWDTVGQIPVDHFIGDCAILDFSAKCAALGNWFSEDGLFRRDLLPRFDEFISCLPELSISEPELLAAFAQAGREPGDVRGAIIFAGLARFWTGGIFEPWEHAYFYAPYLSDRAAEVITGSGISFVGIDAFRLENPITNFRGDELPLIVNELTLEEARSGVRAAVKSALDTLRQRTLHHRLLGEGIVIYENLNIPAALAGKSGTFSGPPLNFQLSGLNDSALTRPYFIPQC